MKAVCQFCSVTDDKTIAMKKIKLGFADVWFDDYRKSGTISYIINCLQTKYEIEFSNDPEFLFCSCFGTEAYLYDCCKIFITGENIIPDFNLYDYGIGFSNIHFDDRYLRFPLYALYVREFKLAQQKHLADYTTRDKFCAIVVSNMKNASSRRAEIVDVLSDYRQVDSGGRYRNNVGGPVKNKIDFLKSYKFSVAFENTSFPGYITEKIIESWAAGTIPIYWGAPDIIEEFNPKAYINCTDRNLNDVLEEVKEIDQNEKLFLEMIRAPILYDEGRSYRSASYVHNDLLLGFFSNIFDRGVHKRIPAEGITVMFNNKKRKISRIENSLGGKIIKKIF